MVEDPDLFDTFYLGVRNFVKLGFPPSLNNEQYPMGCGEIGSKPRDDPLVIFQVGRRVYSWSWLRGENSFDRHWQDLITYDGSQDLIRVAASTAADAIEELFKGLNLPVRLSQVGVPEDGIDLIAKDAMTDFGLHRNVRKIQNVDALNGILASVR